MWPVSQINIKDSFVSLRFNEPFFSNIPFARYKRVDEYEGDQWTGWLVFWELFACVCACLICERFIFFCPVCQVIALPKDIWIRRTFVSVRISFSVALIPDCRFDGRFFRVNRQMSTNSTWIWKKNLPHTNTYTAYDWNKDLLKMMNKLWQINRSHFIYAQCSMAEILLTFWNWAVVLFCVHSFCVSDHFYLRNTMIGSGWLSFYLTSFQFLWQRFTPFDVCAPNWTWAFWHCSPIYGYLHFWIIFIPTNNS